MTDPPSGWDRRLGTIQTDCQFGNRSGNQEILMTVRRTGLPRRWILGSLMAVVGLCAGDSLPAQDPAQPDDPFETVFESVDVEVVNVDVWVTDKQGNPVLDLQPEDFEVSRDGAPVAVTNFYAVAEGRQTSAKGSEPKERPQDPEVGNTSAPSKPVLGVPEEEIIPEEQRQWLIIYVDNFNIDPNERNRILPSVRRFLSESLQNEVRTMLVTYDRVLEVRQPFTRDRHRLMSVLAEIEEESGHAVLRHRDQSTALRSIDDSKDPERAMLYARNYAEEVMNGVGYSIDALHQLVDTLSGLPGRKTLLHVSSGIPMLAGEEMFQAIGDRWTYSEAYGEIGRHDTSRQFEAVNRKANANRVVLNTLDATGLVGSRFSSAEYGKFLGPRMRSTLDSVVPQNLQSPLRLMALETGGRAILNLNDPLPALQQVNTDLRTYYSLGITSGGGSLGRYHQLEVKLKNRQKGWKIRHRQGYRSKDLTVRVEDSLRSALLYDHQDNPLEVKVLWGEPQRYDEVSYLVNLQLQVPVRDLVVLPLAGKQELRLKFFVGAAGENGATSAVDQAPLVVRLDDENLEAARKESVLHSHRLLLKPGRSKVGIAVLDQFDHRWSIVTAFIDAGPGSN